MRTDFILAAAIIAITLGSVAASPFITQVLVLSGMAVVMTVVMTVGMYGLVAGTAAMFLAGGGILVHGVPVLAHVIEGAVRTLPGLAQALLPTLANRLLGVAAGALVLGAVTLVKHVRG